MKTHQAKHTVFSTVASLAFAGVLFSHSLSAQAQATEKKADKTAASAPATKPAVREIEFHIESVDGKTHWMPASAAVKPGEALTLVFHHDLKTGPDFHGVEIDALKIKEQVNRGKEARFNVKIPNDFKGTEIVVKCQFHPGHQPAVLKVESSKSAK